MTDIPETFMERQVIKMHIPEFRMDRTETVIGVPEFKMGRKEIIVRIPEFTAKNVNVEVGNIKQRGEMLSQQAKAEMDANVSDMKKSLQSGITDNVHLLFNCMRSTMQSQRAGIEQAFVAPISEISATISQLEANKATEKAVEVKYQLENLILQKESTIRQIDAQLGQLDSQEQAAIKRAMDSLQQQQI